MNLSAPSPSCDQYPKKLYDFLQSPVFDQIRLNPRAFAPEHSEGVIYFDETDGMRFGTPGGVWSSPGGGGFARRSGSHNWDFREGDGYSDFSTTDDWTDMDLSSIITDTNAVSVLANIYGTGSSTEGACVEFKAKGVTEDETNTVFVRKQATTLVMEQVVIPLPTDGTRYIQYYIDTTGTCPASWSILNFAVMGWFL